MHSYAKDSKRNPLGEIMSGLLEKANEKSSTANVEKKSNDVSKSASKTNSSNVSKEKKLVDADLQNEETLISKVSKVGAGLAAIGFIFSWFLGSYTLEDLTGPVPFGLVVLAIFGTSFYLVWNSLDREKTVTIAVVYILLAGVPYVAGIDNTGSISITDVNIMEDSNAISFKVRGGMSTAYASIVAYEDGSTDGTEVWSEEKSMRGDLASFTVNIDDIFIGNSLGDNSARPVSISYQIEVNDGKKSEYSQQINPEFLTRQVEDTGVKLTPIFKSETSGENTETRFEGFAMEIIFGILPASHTHLNNASHTDGGLTPVFGDYSIDLTVSKDSVSWNHPTITVTGDSISWAQKSDGPAAPTGWIQVSGNEYDSLHGSYLAADGQGFTYEDGDWTFTVTVTHTTHVGDSVLVDSDVCWNLDYEEYADNRNSGGDEFYKAEICKT